MKIKIPCLFNNPELDTRRNSELGINISDSDLIIRNITFYNIDNLVPRVGSGGVIIGTVISSGATISHSLMHMDEIEKMIDKNKILPFKN